MKRAFILSLLLPLANYAEDTPVTPDSVAKISELNAAIAKSPDVVALYSQRGDAHLFARHFAEAVADFEKMIALDPAQDAPHWRLGIAYYFAGQFEKSSKQFVKYHEYDGGDRENGIWKFLADAKALGIEPARRAMLVYTHFDREPFPALYEMFAGTKTTDDVLAEIAAKKLTDNASVMFFANYYGGLNEELLGHRAKAIELLHAVVGNARARERAGYMWQVARMHGEVIESVK